MKDYSEIAHAALYQRVRDTHPEIPAWEDLTEEQKVRMRRANDDHTSFMSALGEEIRGKK